MTELIAIVTKILAIVVTLTGMVSTMDKRVTVLENQYHVQTPTSLGAVSGPDSFFPCETHNGVSYCFTRVGLRSATSSLATIKSPGATSTIQFASCQVGASSNPYANQFTLAWGATAFATTTSIAQNSFNANQGGVVTATGTQATLALLGGVDGAIPPNSFINFRLGTSTVNTNINYAPSGWCAVEFQY